LWARLRSTLWQPQTSIPHSLNAAGGPASITILGLHLHLSPQNMNSKIKLPLSILYNGNMVINDLNIHSIQLFTQFTCTQRSEAEHHQVGSSDRNRFLKKEVCEPNTGGSRISKWGTPMSGAWEGVPLHTGGGVWELCPSPNFFDFFGFRIGEFWCKMGDIFCTVQPKLV